MGDGVLLRSALLGSATGARSLTPMAALAMRQSGWVRAVAGVAALGELVADKLPWTPSRLAPAPLAGRIAFGALAGGEYAHRRGAPVVVPALVGAAAAVAASYAGARWRAFAARRNLDLPAALAEDAAAVTLAWAAAS